MASWTVRAELALEVAGRTASVQGGQKGAGGVVGLLDHQIRAGLRPEDEDVAAGGATASVVRLSRGFCNGGPSKVDARLDRLPSRACLAHESFRID